MFGTRRLERFDLHAFRQSQGADTQPLDDSHRATLDEEGVVTESGEHPICLAVKPAPIETKTPIVDFQPTAWAAEEPPTRPSRDLPPPRARNVDALRTRVTRKFVSLAELVNEAFAGTPLGEGGYTVELTAPKEMSTNGGKLAMELLRLRPRREGYAVVLAGTLNARRAELREYDYVAAWHQDRFERPLPFSRQTWEEFLRRIEAVLRGEGIDSVRVLPPREVRKVARRATRVSTPATIALIVTMSLAAIACARVAMLLIAAP